MHLNCFFFYNRISIPLHSILFFLNIGLALCISKHQTRKSNQNIVFPIPTDWPRASKTTLCCTLVSDPCSLRTCLLFYAYVIILQSAKEIHLNTYRTSCRASICVEKKKKTLLQQNRRLLPAVAAIMLLLADPV